MARKRQKPQACARASVHVTLDADLARRLRAFSGYHGREISAVVAEGLRLVLRGFSARQEPARPGDGNAPAAPDVGPASAA